MLVTISWKDRFKKVCFLVIFLIFIIFHTNLNIVEALSMEKDKTGIVVEQLRLSVPAKFKEVWLTAEKNYWEPWLSLQDGFLGRQIFWDKGKEEGLILVNWRNREVWKSISME